MRCNECRERFSEYLEGRLPAEAAEEVGRHLASCLACARDVADLRAMLEAVRAMPRVPVPEGFVERVHARVAPLGARRGVPVWRWVAASAAAAVLALGAFAVFGPTLERRYGPMNSLAGGRDTTGAPARVTTQAAEKAPLAIDRVAPLDARQTAPSQAPAARPADTKRRAAPGPLGEEIPAVASDRTAPPPAPGIAARRPEQEGLENGRLELEARAAGRAEPAPSRAPAGEPADEEAGAGGAAFSGAAPGEAKAGPFADAAAASVARERRDDDYHEKPEAAASPVAAVPAATGPAETLAGAAKAGAPAAPAFKGRRAAWCVLTLRKPEPDAAAGEGGNLRLRLESRVEARNVSLWVQDWRPPQLTWSLPSHRDLSTQAQAVGGIPPWHARVLVPGTKAVVPLAFLRGWRRPSDELSMRLGALGAAPRSAVYRLLLSGENVPTCGHLLFVPPPGTAPSAVVPPGPAIDVLGTLTAQSGVYLLVPDISAGAPNLALTAVSPEQGLASALQMLGLTVHREGAAWTAR